jgi:hypothetical protein
MKTLIVIGVVAIAGGVFSAIGVCEQDKPSSHRNTEVIKRTVAYTGETGMCWEELELQSTLHHRGRPCNDDA